MGKETKGPKTEIDPRIKGIVMPVATRVFEEKIAPKLIEKDLMDNEGDAKGVATQPGLEYLAFNVVSGVKSALAQAKISAPVGFSLDEIQLSDSIVSSFGEAKVEVNGNNLNLKFDGPGALIMEMDTPLDIEKSDAEKPKGGYNAHTTIARSVKITGQGFVDLGQPKNNLKS